MYSVAYVFFLTKPSYNDVGADYPEVEYFDVTLMKDNQGLGITIAGYVGKDNTPGRLKWGKCRKGGLGLIVVAVGINFSTLDLLKDYLQFFSPNNQ